MRQQRTTTPRRSLNPATRPNYTPISWQPFAVTAATVTMLLSQDSASLVRTGVPQIKALSLAAMPVSVTWSGSTMLLTYASPLSATEAFHCEQGTPQVRNYSGGYLAAGTLAFGSPVTPPPAGTIFAPYCSAQDLRGAIADGVGGTADGLVSANSPGCGYVFNPPAGWILSLFCTGHDLWANIADGLGGTTPTQLSLQSDYCGSSITNMQIAWYPIPDGSGGVDIYCDTNSGSIVSSTGPDFHAGAQALAGYTISGFVINLTFPLPVSSGDVIAYGGAGHAITNDWNQGLAVMAQILP